MFEAVKSRENWDRLTAGEKACNQLQEMCDFVEGCGQDVSNRRAAASAVREGLEKLRTQLFPQGPP